jgi:hypothetical protein
MRIPARMCSISWIPIGAPEGALKRGFDFKFTHYDGPPPDTVNGVDDLERLRDDDAFRFANALSAWIDVEDGEIVGAGYADESGLIMGSTRIRVIPIGATFRAISLPTLQAEPTVTPSMATFIQTVGGRTGVPLPRPVPHPPYVQWLAPVVWTTLSLTIHTDGSTAVDLNGASTFPRHWVYGADGDLLLKSGVTDQKTWVSHSFGDRTPWGEQNSPAVVAASVTEHERRLSEEILQPGRNPEIRRLPEGAIVTEQGEPGEELFLLLDGILSVDVDGQQVGEVGPGAILGERALLEHGVRTSTLTAVTPVRLAVADAQTIDLTKLHKVADLHRRESEIRI